LQRKIGHMPYAPSLAFLLHWYRQQSCKLLHYRHIPQFGKVFCCRGTLHVSSVLQVHQASVTWVLRTDVCEMCFVMFVQTSQTRHVCSSCSVSPTILKRDSTCRMRLSRKEGGFPWYREKPAEHLHPCRHLTPAGVGYRRYNTSQSVPFAVPVRGCFSALFCKVNLGWHGIFDGTFSWDEIASGYRRT
jgi:hypothetical protein